jgi:hypothetical protein
MAGRVLGNETKGLVLRHLATAMYLTASKDKLLLQDRLQHTGTNWAITCKASVGMHACVIDAHRGTILVFIPTHIGSTPDGCACSCVLVCNIRPQAASSTCGTCSLAHSLACPYRRTAAMCCECARLQHSPRTLTLRCT